MTAFADLGVVLGSPLDPHLRAHLSQGDATELAALLHDVREARSAELEDAIVEVLQRVPWGLRGAVRKIAGL